MDNNMVGSYGHLVTRDAVYDRVKILGTKGKTIEVGYNKVSIRKGAVKSESMTEYVRKRDIIEFRRYKN